MINLTNSENKEVIRKIAASQKGAVLEVIENPGLEKEGDIYMYYTKYEHHELERIVGSAHIKRYINTENNVKLT